MKIISLLLGLHLGRAATDVPAQPNPDLTSESALEPAPEPASEEPAPQLAPVFHETSPEPVALDADAPSEPTKTPAPTSRRARRPLREGPYHLELQVQTDFPVSVGGRINAEFPYRIQLSTGVGTLPGSYVDVINAVVVAAGGYDEPTADLIRSTLASSLVWRTHVGWRPLSRRGWYVEGGYGLVTLGGGITGQEALVLLTGGTAPTGGGGGGGGGTTLLNYDVRSTLHMLDVETGWRWLLWRDRIVLSAALGFAGTVASKTVLEPIDASPLTDTAALQALADEGEAYLDDIYTSYVFTPVVTVGIGYRFF